jgi:DNA anti-recombination protein RmuC
MDQKKKTFLTQLDLILSQQKEISDCRAFYQKLEKDLDHKREHLANPEDLSDLQKEIGRLNQEFEEKWNGMFEGLNDSLLKAHDLAEGIGREVAYDFKQLWDYMTDSLHQEVTFDKVSREIDRLKRDFFS